MSAMRRTRIRAALGAGVLLLLVIGWEVAGRLDETHQITPFSQTVVRMWELLTGPELVEDILPSIVRALLGFVIGGALAMVLGVLLGWFRRAEPWLRGVMEFARAVPPPALVPLAFLVAGPNNATRLGVIAFGTFWPVLINVIDGTRRVDAGYIDAARVYAGSGSAVLRRVVLPAALPAIFAGLRIGLAVSLIMMVISEMVSSNSGLGQLVVMSQRLFMLPEMYAGILIIGILGWLMTVGFRWIEARATKWFEGQKGLM
jgi:ABC-type nitrate/sulfonate/bicarbonate transport system permease component